MKERPILFNHSNVRSIMLDIKTMTRRAFNPQPRMMAGLWMWLKKKMVHALPNQGEIIYELLGIWEVCPYGRKGDRLWVKETFTYGPDGEIYYAANYADPTNHGGTSVIISRDGKRQVPLRWKPSIFMPRNASRILLEITEIRVERLQDISLADINAEGTPDTLDPSIRSYGTRREQFQRLWDSINAKKYPWDKNPWVWVIEFKRIEA